MKKLIKTSPQSVWSKLSVVTLSKAQQQQLKGGKGESIIIVEVIEG